MSTNGNNPADQAADQRRRYLTAFNTTMVRIWQEQAIKLGVYDTGRLVASVRFQASMTDGKVTQAHSQWQTLEYGIYQDRGTGRETPKGNPGDIGRLKIRQRRPWLSRKFWSSTMNIRDYFAQSLGRQAAIAIPTAMGAHI